MSTMAPDWTCGWKWVWVWVRDGHGSRNGHGTGTGDENGFCMDLKLYVYGYQANAGGKAGNKANEHDGHENYGHNERGIGTLMSRK